MTGPCCADFINRVFVARLVFSDTRIPIPAVWFWSSICRALNVRLFFLSSFPSFLCAIFLCFLWFFSRFVVRWMGDNWTKTTWTRVLRWHVGKLFAWSVMNIFVWPHVLFFCNSCKWAHHSSFNRWNNYSVNFSGKLRANFANSWWNRSDITSHSTWE